MAEREALERLGRIHQIAPDYYDVWGKRHEVPDASLAALLAGRDAGTADLPGTYRALARAATTRALRSGRLDPEQAQRLLDALSPEDPE